MDLSRSKTRIGPQLHIARHCRTTYQNGLDHDFGNALSRQPRIAHSSSIEAVRFSSSRTTKRFPSSQSSSRRRSDFRIRLMFIHVYSWLKTRLKIFENFAPQIPERILKGDRNEATGRPPSGDELSKQDPIPPKPGSRSACF